MACRSSEEGCLDPNALNFQPSADKDCKCCNFSKAQLNTLHRGLDTSEIFELESPFYDAQNTALEAKDIKLLISNLQIQDLSDNWHSIQDTINAKYYNGDFAFLPNSFGIITPNKTSIDMGKFVAEGNYKGFRFIVGLSGQATQIDSRTVRPTNHILGSAPIESTYDSLTQSPQTYIMNIIKGTDTFNIKSTIAHEITLYGHIETRPGSNIFLNTYILWARLFDNIDWNNDSTIDIQRKIDNNLPYIFQIQE